MSRVRESLTGKLLAELLRQTKTRHVFLLMLLLLLRGTEVIEGPRLLSCTLRYSLFTALAQICPVTRGLLVIF